MIDVKDLDFKSLTRTRKVNGERNIEIDVFPTEQNKNHFDLVVEEMSIKVFDDSYIIKKLKEESIGERYWKQSTAIHDFFVNMINKQQPRIHNGSITFNNYMQMVFEGTGYTFAVVDQFLARSFENLGNDNRLALLQKGLDRFQAEFELVGTEVRFKQMIGEDTDTQFRYGHNVKSISREVDTTDLATVIRGTGAEGVEAYYRSPNADIFGEIDAPPVDDERFTTQASLLDEMKARLQDEPKVTITVNFVDLRAAGYPYNVPNEGDRVWLIYEPMDDLMIETRILEVKEYFDAKLNVIRTEVTLSNHKKSFAGTMFDNIQKQFSKIVNDDGVIHNSVLDEAVRIATQSILNARTELSFPDEGGIYAIDKDDPNKLVVYNSAGLGISDDGGNTFRTAITGDGIVADVITAGTLRGIDIIGTNITSFNPVTNEVVTLENGEITTFDDGKQRFGIYGNGLVAYHWVTEREVATFRSSSREESSEYGADIGAYGDYFIIGHHVGDGIIKPQLEFNWKGEIDETELLGGLGDRDSTLLLSASRQSDAPFIRLNNRLISDTTWGNVMMYVGLDNKKPSDDNFRNGFEVWQYTGDGDGNVQRLLNIGMDPNGAKFIVADVDDLWVDGRIRVVGTSTVQGMAYVENHLHVNKSITTGDAYYLSHNENPSQTRYRMYYEGSSGSFVIASNDSAGDWWTRMELDGRGQGRGINFYNHLNMNEWSIQDAGNIEATGTGTFRSVVLTNDGGVNNTRFYIEYIPSSLNVEFATKDSNGDWWKRIEIEGRGGTGNIHLWNRIKSEGTMNATTTNSSNMHIFESSSRMSRVTSSRKYKINEQPVGVDPYNIHKIIPKDWHDKSEVEQYADELTKKYNGEEYNLDDIDLTKIRRIPGAVAEDFEDAGLGLYVNYRQNGEIAGLMYDRAWLLLVPISRDHENRLNEYDDRFGTIENRLKKLENEMNKLKGVA